MLLIFDLDGVLLTVSWSALFEAYQRIAVMDGGDYRKHFKNFSEFKKWWNPDWRMNHRQMGITDDERANKIFYEIYNPSVCLFPWAGDVLGELAKRHPLAILTNRHKKESEEYLAPIKKFFFLMVGKEDVVNLKPDPEGARLILNKSGFRSDSALFIGDMAMDIMAGKSAGMKTGAVKWGFGDWRELLSLNPDYAFSRYQDLLWI